MKPVQFVVTVVVAVPLFLWVGWPHPWSTTFLLALISVGSGHAVQALVERSKDPSELRDREEP
jgi:hypothetical protein